MMTDEEKKRLIEGSYYVVRSSILFDEKQEADWFKNYLESSQVREDYDALKVLDLDIEEVTIDITTKPKKKKGSK